jgi:long-chain acyl-CoA synthetase
LAGSPTKRKIFFWARRVGLLYGQKKRDKAPISGWLRLQYRLADRLVFSKLRARTGGNLRLFVSGGAPLAPKINEFFYAAGLIILEGYGLTETSPVLACNSFENFKIGSVGKPFVQTEIKIADDGEIMARGPQIMLGYYNNEAATREVLSDDGWLATGDIGHIDEEGYLFITDRKKDVIVTAGGKNIAPQPIENAIKESKYVSQVVVIGDKLPYLSCLIVPNFESLLEHAKQENLASAEPVELIKDAKVMTLYDGELARINANLPSFSQIKKYGLLENEFTLEAGELTPTLKVKRWAIFKKYKHIIDELYPAALE